MKRFLIVLIALILGYLAYDTARYYLGWYIDLQPDAPVSAFMSTDANTRVGDTPVSATSSSAVHKPTPHTPTHSSRLRVSRPSSAASKTDSSNARASPHSASVQLTTPWPSNLPK